MAKQNLTERVLDKRVVDRYVRRGNLSDRDYSKHLKDLPDLEEACDTVNLDEPPTGGNGEAETH